MRLSVINPRVAALLPAVINHPVAAPLPAVITWPGLVPDMAEGLALLLHLIRKLACPAFSRADARWSGRLDQWAACHQLSMYPRTNASLSAALRSRIATAAARVSRHEMNM